MNYLTTNIILITLSVGVCWAAPDYPAILKEKLVATGGATEIFNQRFYGMAYVSDDYGRKWGGQFTGVSAPKEDVNFDAARKEWLLNEIGRIVSLISSGKVQNGRLDSVALVKARYERMGKPIPNDLPDRKLSDQSLANGLLIVNEEGGGIVEINQASSLAIKKKMISLLFAHTGIDPSKALELTVSEVEEYFSSDVAATAIKSLQDTLADDKLVRVTCKNIEEWQVRKRLPDVWLKPRVRSVGIGVENRKNGKPVFSGGVYNESGKSVPLAIIYYGLDGNEIHKERAVAKALLLSEFKLKVTDDLYKRIGAIKVVLEK